MNRHSAESEPIQLPQGHSRERGIYQIASENIKTILRNRIETRRMKELAYANPEGVFFISSELPRAKGYQTSDADTQETLMEILAEFGYREDNFTGPTITTPVIGITRTITTHPGRDGYSFTKWEDTQDGKSIGKKVFVASQRVQRPAELFRPPRVQKAS